MSGVTGPGDAPLDPGPAAAAVEALAEGLSALDESWRSVELAADLLDAAAMRDLLPEPRGRLVPDTAAAWRFVVGGTESEPTFSAPDGSALDAHAGEGFRTLLQTVRSMLAG